MRVPVVSVQPDIAINRIDGHRAGPDASREYPGCSGGHGVGSTLTGRRQGYPALRPGDLTIDVQRRDRYRKGHCGGLLGRYRPNRQTLDFVVRNGHRGGSSRVTHSRAGNRNGLSTVLVRIVNSSQDQRSPRAPRRNRDRCGNRQLGSVIGSQCHHGVGNHNARHGDTAGTGDHPIALPHRRRQCKRRRPTLIVEDGDRAHTVGPVLHVRRNGCRLRAIDQIIVDHSQFEGCARLTGSDDGRVGRNRAGVTTGKADQHIATTGGAKCNRALPGKNAVALSHGCRQRHSEGRGFVIVDRDGLPLRYACGGGGRNRNALRTIQHGVIDDGDIEEHIRVSGKDRHRCGDGDLAHIAGDKIHHKV